MITDFIGATQPGINPLWVDAMQLVMERGRTVRPRGEATRELLGLSLVLDDPARNVVTIPQRRLNYYFMVAEWFWIMAGMDDAKMISHYNKQIAAFSDDGLRFFGAYGPRFRDELHRMLRLLRTDDPMTRQAVWASWRHTPPRHTKDTPCTLNTQYLLRDGRLTAIVNMRSSDLWLGLPYDMFNFSMLQRQMAERLRVECGPLCMRLGSAHLYEKHWDAATTIIQRWEDTHGCLAPADISTASLPPGQLPESPLFHGKLLTAEQVARDFGVVQEDVRDDWRPWFEILASRTRTLQGDPPIKPRDDNNWLLKLIRHNWFDEQRRAQP